MRYTYRRAEPADLERLVELLQALQEHLESSNPDLWRMQPTARHNLKGQISARLTAPLGCALVAEHETDGVVGMLFGRVVINKRYTPTRTGLLDQVYVREDHRRARVAARLVAEACHFFAEQQAHDLSLRYVVGNEEAAAFWSALGFSPRIVTSGAQRQAVEKASEMP